MRRLAYVLLAAMWLAGIWIWLHPAPDARPPRPLEPDPRAAGGAMQAPGIQSTPGARAAPGHTRPSPRRRVRQAGEVVPTVELHVRSSVGLPLLAVEGQVPGGEWERADLDGDVLELDADSPRFLLRAAGHVPVEAGPNSREVVLVPDALLTVEAPHLRTSLQDLAMLRCKGPPTSMAESEQRRKVERSGLLAEFPDADHLLVAFSPSVLESAYPGNVDVSFRSPDGRPVEITLRALPGLRVNWKIPEGDVGAAAPLEVNLEYESKRPDHSSLWINELDAPSESAQQLDYSWGSVRIGHARPPLFDTPIGGSSTFARLGGLALARRYCLCGRGSSGSFGTLEFVHDGRERTLFLHAPYVVTGRVVDSQSLAGLLLPDVRSRPTGDAANPDWFTRDAEYGEDGRFELHLPGESWGRHGSIPPLEASPRFALEASAGGHRSTQLEFAWDGGRSVDLGTVALASNPRPIRIAGNQIELPPAADPAAFTFGDEPALQWTLRHLVHSAEDGHELELAFAGDTAQPGLLVPCRNLVSGSDGARPFERKLGRLLLLDAGGEALAFRLGEGEAYRQLMRRTCMVSIECAELPREGGAWRIGWRGEGTWAGFRTVNAKGHVADAVTLPAFATELWWSAGEAPPDWCKRPGGALVLSGAAQALVLR